jgi:seryl-tRNA synthetase
VNARAELVAEQRAAATKLEQLMKRRNRLKSDMEETQRQYEQEQSNLADARKHLSESLDQMELDRNERAAPAKRASDAD